MESQLRKQLDTIRSESKEDKRMATDLRLQLVESEEERNASDTAFQTQKTIEANLRGQLALEADQLSEVRSALQVQQRLSSSKWPFGFGLLRAGGLVGNVGIYTMTITWGSYSLIP